MSTIAMIPELVLNQFLVNKWNDKLSKPHSLAPRNIGGLISDEEYNNHNDSFSDFCSNYFKSQLEIMNSEETDLDGFEVTIVGLGLARGLKFIPFANDLNLTVNLFDVSDVAIANAKKVLKKMNALKQNGLHQIEITGSEGEIPTDSKLVCVSQFVQILTPELMFGFMKWLKDPMQLRNARIAMIHPFGSDNPNAHWGDTTPYELFELIEPIESATGTTVSCSEILKFNYFNCHIYSAFTLSLKE